MSKDRYLHLISKNQHVYMLIWPTDTSSHRQYDREWEYNYFEFDDGTDID